MNFPNAPASSSGFNLPHSSLLNDVNSPFLPSHVYSTHDQPASPHEKGKKKTHLEPRDRRPRLHRRTNLHLLLHLALLFLTQGRIGRVVEDRAEFDVDYAGAGVGSGQVGEDDALPVVELGIGYSVEKGARERTSGCAPLASSGCCTFKVP